jgi:polar amino acid transport system substrate-binding protein
MMKSLSIILGLCVAMMGHADVITLRADQWMPYNGDPNSAMPGYLIEIAKSAFEKAGHKMDYQIMNWERTVAWTRTGDIDCAVGATRDDDASLVFPQYSMGSNVTSIFVKKGNPWRFTNIEDLKKINLGVIGAYGYGEPLDSYIKDPANAHFVQDVKGDNALEQNIRKLLSGRIDALVEAPPVIAYKLANLNMKDALEDAGTPNTLADLYIACSPKKPNSAAYVKLLEDELQRMRATGELKTLLDKYNVKDWQ